MTRIPTDPTTLSSAQEVVTLRPTLPVFPGCPRTTAPTPPSQDRAGADLIVARSASFRWPIARLHRS